MEEDAFLNPLEAEAKAHFLSPERSEWLQVPNNTRFFALLRMTNGLKTLKTKNQKPKTKNRKPKTENRKPKTENGIYMGIRSKIALGAVLKNFWRVAQHPWIARKLAALQGEKWLFNLLYLRADAGRARGFAS